MRLFSFIKQRGNKGQFVSNAGFSGNLAMQAQLAPRVLGHLRTFDITEEKELKLEYFFYTNSADKAEQLASEINRLGYSVWHGVSGPDKKKILINGWTNKIKMSDENLELWVKEMCELGYKYDCEFDGWGTTPDQE